ncbi:hypothetical protein ABDI30_18260 [Paenibacillus cisolokensis]|uniref:hypothetical protein n=1 Tax=Paenibacillus cisolokensis TaxID=1658519 RepID=UPI003D28609A
MNQVNRVIHIHMKQKLGWFYLPWAIMIFSFIVNLLIGFIVNGEKFYTGGLATMFIYMFVGALIGVVQLFPFSLGFSIRRTDFYTGTVILIIGISIFTAILLLLLSSLENWTNGWGERMHFFHLPYLNDGSILAQFTVFAILLITFAMLGMLIGSFYLRYRGLKTFIFLAGIFILLSAAGVIVTAFDGWMSVFEWFIGKTAFELSLWCLPGALLMAIGSLFMLRKSTV